jgi:hypothetical protein
MDEAIRQIGKNASKIKDVVALNSNYSIIDLMEETSLNEAELYMAMGWLFYQYKNFDFEKMDVLSNFDEKVKKVSNVLFGKSKKNVATIARLSHLRSNEVYAALGALAQKNRLIIFDGKTLQTKYSLKRHEN